MYLPAIAAELCCHHSGTGYVLWSGRKSSRYLLWDGKRPEDDSELWQVSHYQEFSGGAHLPPSMVFILAAVKNTVSYRVYQNELVGAPPYLVPRTSESLSEPFKVFTMKPNSENWSPPASTNQSACIWRGVQSDIPRNCACALNEVFTISMLKSLPKRERKEHCTSAFSRSAEASRLVTWCPSDKL